MSRNDRLRHLNSFIADSYPPPMSQHLPQMPPASQKSFMPSANHQQINFLDPFNSGSKNYNPFDRFVANSPTFPTSVEDDQDESDSTEGSDSSTEIELPIATSNPTTAKKTTSPAPLSTQKPTSAAPPPTPTGIPLTIPPPPPQPLPQQQPQQQPQQPQQPPVQPKQPQQPQQKTTTTTVAQAAQEPIIVDEPRGIMDQSMSFLKRNFWPILTVLVVLIMIGVAFIYFANRNRNDATNTNVKKNDQMQTLHSPQWVDDDDDDDDDANQAQQINQQQLQNLQEEKQKTEETCKQLQEKLQAMQEEMQNAAKAASAQQSDITKLQEMCERLCDERQDLQNRNAELSQILIQSGLLDEEQKNEEPQTQSLQQKEQQQPEQQIQQDEKQQEVNQLPTQQPSLVVKNPEQQEIVTIVPGGAKLINFDEELDVEAIENDSTNLSQPKTITVIDNTLDTEKNINEPQKATENAKQLVEPITTTSLEQEEEKVDDETVPEQSEKLPWQK